MLCCVYDSRISILLYTCMCALCCSRANKDAPPTTPASKGASRKSRIAVPAPPAVSEPESSENEGTTPKTTASPSHIPSVASHTSTTTAANAHQQQQSDTPLAATDQLEKSDRISKEKQKFFRLSAIFADKKRAEKKKEEAQRQTAAAAAAAETSSSRTCRSTNKSTVTPTVEGKVNKTETTSVAVDVSKRPNAANRQTRTDNASDSCKVVHKPGSDVKTYPSRTSKLKSNNKIDMNKDSKAKPVAQKASVTVAAVTTAKTKATPKSVSKQAVQKTNDKKSSVVVPVAAESSSSSDSDDEEEEEDKDGNSSATSDSSEECSSSSGDETTSSDSDSDSSNHQSETSRMSLTGSKLKLPSTMYVTSSNPSMGTFGSISGISSEKDKIWGFAAAAAEANKKTFATNQGNHTFGSFSEINNTANGFSTLSGEDKNSSSATTSSTSSNDRHKPGFGQLKGLFDGLSHLFTTPDHSRSRAGPAPNYSLSRRKRAADKAVLEKEQPPKKIPEVTVPVNNTKTDKPIKQIQQPQQALPVEVPTKVTENNKSLKNMMPVAPKPENAVGIASIVTKQSNITIPPKIPKRIAPNPVPPSSEPERKVPRPGVFLPSSSEDELHPSSVSHHSNHHQHNHHHHHHLHHQSAPHVQQQHQHPWIQMTPSNLVKTAVNSKRHEFERRRFLKGEAPYGGLGFMGFSHCSFLEDVRMKKRNLIAEATQTNHPLLVPEPSNNQTGKMMGHRTLPQPIRTFR